MITQNPQTVAYLEQIQRTVYANLGITPTWLRENYQSRVREIANTYHKTKNLENGTTPDFIENQLSRTLLRNDMNSKFQDPGWYFLLCSLTDDLNEVLYRTGVKNLPPHLFGSLPTGQVNGMALRVPQTKEFVILIEEGLFAYANLAAKALVMAFPLRDEGNGMMSMAISAEDARIELGKNPVPLEKFKELLLAYVIGGHPHFAKSYFSDSYFEQVASAFRNSFELFVIGHEYGHILAGHLTSNKTKKAMLADESEDEIATNWQNEFEADVRGLDLMLMAQQKNGLDLPLSFSGAVFFFKCVEIIEKAISIIQTGDVTASHSITHPPTQTRLEFLYTTINNSVPVEHTAETFQVAKAVEVTMDLMFGYCEPALKQAHDAGTEVAKAWRQHY